KELDYDTRHLLVSAHVKNGDFAAAAAECRRILGMRPGDRRTLRLLADVLSWKKDYKESLALFEELARLSPPEPDVAVRTAEVILWSGDYDVALGRFQSLLQEQFDQPRLWPAFCAAAANARVLNDDHRRTFLGICDRVRKDGTKDAIFLGRMAWVLHRLNERADAEELLDRAIALPLPEATGRKELAGVLAAFGRGKDALRLYEGMSLDLDDHLRLSAIYAAEKDFASAATHCRAILRERPDDVAATRQLADVLSWNKEYTESLSLFERLRNADPKNTELRRRLAQVTLWSGGYDKALALFQQMLEANFEQPDSWPDFVNAAASAGRLSDAQIGLAQRIHDRHTVRASKDCALLTRLAWVMHRAKAAERAADLVERALASLRVEPGGSPAPAMRKELAGVLAAVGRTTEALRLYDGLLLDVEDRRRLAGLHAAAKDFAAAEQQCRAVLQEKPDDAAALRQLADVLSWKHDYSESLALFERLVRDHPQDGELALRLAEVTLWSGAHDKALAPFQALLTATFDQPGVWPSFVNAAASATRLTDDHARTAVRIAERMAGECKDAVVLARLAWVLQRVKQQERAGSLLTRALALRPTDAPARKELAGVLAAAGRTKDALRLYEGLTLDADDHSRLAALYAADKDFEAAERQCRTLLHERPDDVEAVRLLASVLTWKKDYPEAMALVQRLADENPQDSELSLQLAQLALWSGDYEKAAARFEALLDAHFEQPELWRGFVDAVAGLGQLSESQAALVRR
ncbi:MAG TPA: tetratricopeptide repeat protein, partial [Gemmataceae bacterium]|nr:tetratricopeptide repeat protein [Gemmataceae bacterium]